MAGKGRRDNSGGINIGVRSFLIAIGIIFILMVATYILTLVVPGGEYARVQDASGLKPSAILFCLAQIFSVMPVLLRG